MELSMLVHTHLLINNNECNVLCKKKSVHSLTNINRYTKKYMEIKSNELNDRKLKRTHKNTYTKQNFLLMNLIGVVIRPNAHLLIHNNI